MRSPSPKVPHPGQPARARVERVASQELLARARSIARRSSRQRCFRDSARSPGALAPIRARPRGGAGESAPPNRPRRQLKLFRFSHRPFSPGAPSADAGHFVSQTSRRSLAWNLLVWSLPASPGVLANGRPDRVRGVIGIDSPPQKSLRSSALPSRISPPGAKNHESRSEQAY